MRIEKILEEALNTTPQWQPEPAFHPTAAEFSGIQAITYDGLTTEDGKTSTFAYLGIPAQAGEHNPVPAVVLVHGGGGQAFLPWVKLWTERGYAAIAMSTRGYFPCAANAGNRMPDDPDYRHGMYGSFLKEGYVDSPEEDSLRNSELPIARRWFTHALVKVIHAHNLLRSLPQVNRGKIGITGISWGGVITSVVITHDPRFAFAVPVYGSGYLSQALSYMGPIFRLPGNGPFRAEDRFDRVRIPVLWLAWNDDNHFSINANSLSYLATAPNQPKTSLALIDKLYHSHPCGWNPPIIHAFAEWIVNNGQPLVTFLTQPSGKNASAELSIPKGIGQIEATLYWIDAPMTTSIHDKYNEDMPDAWATFMDQIWQRSSAAVQGNRISAVLPENACGYYFEIRYRIDGKEMIATSVYSPV